VVDDWTRRLRERLRPYVPARVRGGIRVLQGKATATPVDAPAELPPAPESTRYESVYEAHARALPPELAIGDGDYDEVGQIELSALVQEGLTPSSVLFDFGCGTGRLAVHAVPFLRSGHYVGTDISETMLARCAVRLDAVDRAGSKCHVDLHHQISEDFPVDDASVDVLCAFSVFTHMDHEDAYRYLVAATRVVKPGGVLVASLLPLHLHDAQKVFLASAADPADERWSKVRNVVTSTELFETVARLAGWTVVRWHDGESRSIRLLGTDDELDTLGQSIVVMQVATPADGSAPAAG
jgi:ubiquinone/menaquinone biosynthesis C-methylase UbiE